MPWQRAFPGKRRSSDPPIGRATTLPETRQVPDELTANIVRVVVVVVAGRWRAVRRWSSGFGLVDAGRSSGHVIRSRTSTRFRELHYMEGRSRD